MFKMSQEHLLVSELVLTLQTRTKSSQVKCLDVLDCLKIFQPPPPYPPMQRWGLDKIRMAKYWKYRSWIMCMWEFIVLFSPHFVCLKLSITNFLKSYLIRESFLSMYIKKVTHSCLIPCFPLPYTNLFLSLIIFWPLFFPLFLPLFLSACSSH